MIGNSQRAFSFELGRFWITFTSDCAGIERNPELTLNLGVFFRQVAGGTHVPYDPGNTSATAPGVTSLAWTEPAWRRYKNIIINNSNRFWNGRFWILPPATSWSLCQFSNVAPIERNRAENSRFPTYAQAGTSGEPMQNLFSYNVFCKTNVYQAPSPAHAHITFDVPYLPSGFRDDGNFINFADAAGSGQGRLASGAVQARSLSGAAVIPGHRAAHHHYQRQYIHEIGHALGQRHVGFDVNDTLCAEAPSRVAGATHDHCYVGNSETDEMNIMGSGESIANFNANPWKAVMANLTGTTAGAWGVSRRRVWPRFIGRCQRRIL